MSKVTILGAGPSGLLAALAAEQNGHNVEILARGEKSLIDGAQWLQKPIPDLTKTLDNPEPTMITYAKVGSVDGYARKAYGEPEAQVSWDSFVSGDRPGWPLREAYDELWAIYEHRILTYSLQPVDLRNMLDKHPDRAFFCSIPATMLCFDLAAHDFDFQKVVFTNEPFVAVPNMIVYNGRASDEWYRSSCLFGKCSTEYAIHDEYTMEGVSGSDIRTGWRGKEHREGIKPISNNCSCWSSYPNLTRVGRFGTWRRGVLVDHAYHQTKDRT